MTASLTPRPATALVAAALALLLPGCSSSDRIALHGAVSFDGAPIDNGTITFVPDGGDDKRPKVSAKIAAGKYAFEPNFGPMPGKYKVEITWDKKTGKKVSTGDADTRDETKQMLPPKFNAQTELTAEIKSGEASKDFDLKTK